MVLRHLDMSTVNAFSLAVLVLLLLSVQPVKFRNIEFVEHWPCSMEW